ACSGFTDVVVPGMLWERIAATVSGGAPPLDASIAAAMPVAIVVRAGSPFQMRQALTAAIMTAVITLEAATPCGPNIWPQNPTSFVASLSSLSLQAHPVRRNSDPIAMATIMSQNSNGTARTIRRLGVCSSVIDLLLGARGATAPRSTPTGRVRR